MHGMSEHIHSGSEKDQHDHSRQALIKRAKLLSWISLGWISVEGIIGMFAGIQAQSIALIGWGTASLLEGLASVIVIWRFTGSRVNAEDSESAAQKMVAWSFYLLAGLIVLGVAATLLGGSHAEESTLGIVLTVTSALLMPILGRAKRKVGEQLNSGATEGEGMQNILCGIQAAAVLVGLAANALIGWWWLDPLIALFVAFVAFREGREMMKGEDADHCCAPPIIKES